MPCLPDIDRWELSQKYLRTKILKTLIRDRLLVFDRKIKLKASRWFIFRKIVQY